MDIQNTTDKLRELCTEPNQDELEDSFSWARWLIAGPISVILALLSTYGNCVSLCILNALRIRKSVRFYLSVLAIANAALSQCTLWYYAIGETVAPFALSTVFFANLTVILNPVSQFTLTMSVWMVLTVTVDRYFALAKPLQHRAFDSRTRAILVTISIIVAAVLFSIPPCFELKLTYDCEQFNVTGLVLLPTDLRLNRSYILLYSVLARGIFLHLGPFCVITVLSLRMLCVVYAARALRSNLDASTEKPKCHGENTTLMLLVVVLKFLICNSPSVLINLWENIHGSVETSNSGLFKWCVELSNLLVTANSASDSIVYLRWRHKQTKSITYTAIPKSIFTAEDAAHLRKQYNLQRHNVSRVASCLTNRLSEDVCLEIENIQSTIDVMMMSIGDANDEHRMIISLNELGAKHMALAIAPATWNKFKDEFVKCFSTPDDSKLWSRLICVLIKEFRKGQLSSIAEQRSSARHV